MSNPYDALRKVIEHEANQDDDGGFFARLGGLEPDPEDDGPTARGLFQHLGPGETAKLGRRLDDALAQYQPRPAWASKGGHIPGQPLPVRPGRSWNPALGQYPPWYKHRPIVKVRRKWVWIIFRTWAWECQICYISDHQSTWRKAYAQADRHARNHHRRDEWAGLPENRTN